MPNWTDEQFEAHSDFNRCNVCREWTYWRNWGKCPVCKTNMCGDCLTQAVMPGDEWSNRLCVPCHDVSRDFVIELEAVIKAAAIKRSNIVRRWKRKSGRIPNGD